MKKITEHKIEQYLRFSYELTKEEMEEIKEVLEYSEEAQKMYAFLKQYYDELDRVSGIRSYVIPLKTKKDTPQFSRPVVLAAMSAEKKAASLVTKATLISEEHKTLVRVLEDQSDHTLQFHVIGERPDNNERAILSVVKHNVDLVTDNRGKLKNVRELSDIHWNEVSTLLRLPVYKTEFALNNKSFTLTDIAGTDVRIGQDKEHLIVTIEDITSSGLTRILMVQDNSVELRRLENSKVRFQLDKQADVQLYFYE